MAPEVLAKAFEPFFTTKGVGKGTGLGLSMVYGFAKQSHGHVNIYSEVGHGTTVNLYVPLADRSAVAKQAPRNEDGPKISARVLLVEDQPGVLARIAALFSRRGYNIESLTVAPTEDLSLSRMTIQTHGSDDVIEQITKHLNRLIEVVKVVDLTEGAYTERELMLVKVRAVGKEREEMKRMADIFRGRIIDVTEKSYTLELTGDVTKNDAFLEAIDRSAILETVRTGACGIGRGERILRV